MRTCVNLSTAYGKHSTWCRGSVWLLLVHGLRCQTCTIALVHQWLRDDCIALCRWFYCEKDTDKRGGSGGGDGSPTTTIQSDVYACVFLCVSKYTNTLEGTLKTHWKIQHDVNNTLAPLGDSLMLWTGGRHCLLFLLHFFQAHVSLSRRTECRMHVFGGKKRCKWLDVCVWVHAASALHDKLFGIYPQENAHFPIANRQKKYIITANNPSVGKHKHKCTNWFLFPFLFEIFGVVLIKF